MRPTIKTVPLEKPAAAGSNVVRGLPVRMMGCVRDKGEVD